MKSASTSCPASRISRAATAESTPPDSATITRAMSGRRPRRQLLHRQVVQQGERVADAAQVVVDAAQHQGTAQLPRARGELVAPEPVPAQDRAVERERLVALAD